MNADKDHPRHDPGHFKHLAAVDHLQTLLNAIDDTPAESFDEMGQHTTADLKEIMAPALKPVGSPEAVNFDRVSVPEGMDWDGEFENAARGWMHGAGLSQGEIDGVGDALTDSMKLSPDHLEEMKGRTIRTLNDRYGDNLPDTLAAARRVAEELGAFEKLEETGLSNDWRAIEPLIRVAQRKGYI